MLLRGKNLGLVLIIVVLLVNSFTAFAANPGDEEYKKIKAELEQKISRKPLSQCRTSLIPSFDIELYQFMQFLETNFQNKSSNSSLTNTAIARYRDYKRNLNGIFAQLKPMANAETYKEANENFIMCGKLKDEYFAVAKKSLIDHIKKNTMQKQATVLIEKYQAINSKLRELNLEIAQLYGYFMAFYNKLPGFLQSCVTS